MPKNAAPRLSIASRKSGFELQGMIAVVHRFAIGAQVQDARSQI